ncbi:MAG TPA: ABC transporter ATP-binding protein [Clostridiaceae bacterium]|nr:ABC transporter ATP-binding protein [Clostridiaceae bacterium]
MTGWRDEQGQTNAKSFILHCGKRLCMIRRFISYYKPYLNILLFDLFCAAVIGATGLVFPILLRNLTSDIFVRTDNGLMLQGLFWTCIWLFVLYVLQSLAQYFVAYYGHVMGARMETDMRSALFSHMERLSFSYFDKSNTGSLMSRLIADLFDITELAHHGPEDLFISFVKIVGAFVILITIHVETTLVLIAVTLIMFFVSFHFNRRMRQTFMDNRLRIAEVNAIVQDSLAGIRTVQSFANEHLELKKFEHGNLRFLNSKRSNYLVMGRYHSINTFLQGMLYVAVVLAGGYFVVQGEVQAADIIIYVLYINMFLDPIKRLINFTEQFQKGMTGFIRMTEVIDTKPDVKDRKQAEEAGALTGHIEFADVSFAYETDEPVLTGINATIPARTTVALVGPSGAGKSTFCSLIPRFYDVDAGSVSVDGRDVRDLTLASLRANIGVVQQEVYIFNSSVRENIAYGDPNASDEAIELAAKRANIHDFIMGLPDGYDTMMGERGVRFSGGQKQRISIARVFLKNPPILILDEATSSLDNESERFIQQSLNDLSRDRTTIVIAHRLSTIKNADEILVLTEDGIAERGSHDALLRSGGLYARLYQMQFAE